MSRNIQRLLSHIVLGHKPCVHSARFASRWTHRNPGKVMLPFEPTDKVNLKKEKVIALDPSIFKKSKETTVNTAQIEDISDSDDEIKSPIFTKEKSKEIKSKREEKMQKRKFYLSQKKVFDDDGEIIFEKLNDNDGRVGPLLVKLKSKKERMRSGHTLVEGWRLIADGLEAKCKLKYVLYSRAEELEKIKPFLPKTGVIMYKIPYKEIELFSDVETPPGIFGIFQIPSPEQIKKQTKPLPLHFICDNIRVPGNLGAILRAAVGAGCEKVLLTKGCVDVWDPKVIRSAAGAHFRLPIHHSIEWPDMPSLMDPATSVFIADSNTYDVDSGDDQLPVLPYYSVEFAPLKHITMVIGGETEGISEDSYALATSKNGVRLNIPLQKGVDSLNTGMATAVIALEIRKQLIQAYSKIRQEKNLKESIVNVT